MNDININLDLFDDKDEFRSLYLAIVSNQAKCLNCGDVIFSAHRHDYKRCSCGVTMVDGGNEYLRRGGGPMEEQSIKIDRTLLEKIVKLFEDNFDLSAEAMVVSLIEFLEKHDYDTAFKAKQGAITDYVREFQDSGRNALGLAFAALRAVRDQGYLDSLRTMIRPIP